MFKIIINKIIKKIERRINVLYLFFLKKRIHRHILSNTINSKLFFKLVSQYLNIFDHEQYVALGHLKTKIQDDRSKQNINPINYLLPDQKMILPSFFGNNLPFLEIDKCLGIGGHDIQKEYVREVKKHTNNLVQIITFQNFLVDAKSQIVNKLNSVKGLTDTFIKTANGFKVTNPEGYVAIDRVSGGAVKLVDRMEFSFNNFTAIKAWDK